jgi:hypothetical protein
MSGKDKGDELDVTLKDMVVRLAAIEAIVWPLQPLRDQVLKLVAMVTEKGQQQDALQLTLTHVENTLADPSAPRPVHRHIAQEEDVEAGDEFMPAAHKLQFPTFDDKSYLLPWLNRCDRYFRLRRTPEDKMVAYYRYYRLELWYYRLWHTSTFNLLDDAVLSVGAQRRPTNVEPFRPDGE